MLIAGAAVAVVAALAPFRAVSIAERHATPAGRQPPAARPQFDVASIRPSSSDSIMNVRPLPGRLIADATLRVLMQYAYGVQPFQIEGGPKWLTTDRYEIDAKADGAVNRNQLFLMLQSLLEQRFQLKTRRAMRDLPVFTLVPSGTGLKLAAPTEGGCTESAAEAALEFADGRMAVPGELPPAKVRCGTANVALGRRSAQIRGGRIVMPELARILSLVLGRTVRDGTGFTASFDVQLDFVPDDTTPAVPPPPPGSGISGATLAQAVQQQLGLRLQSTRGPVDVIVIDDAERPSPN
jgi:uncharacterized protein (TIGR03435 family)